LRGGGGTLNHWYYSETRPGWYFTGTLNYPFPSVQNKFGGYPVFVQTDDSNFAVVVRNVDGSLWEVSLLAPFLFPLVNIRLSRTQSQRNTKTSAFTFQPVISGPATILQYGLALEQSDVNLDLNDPNSAGNLYVVAVLASGKMQIFYRASSNNSSCHCSLNKTWISTETFESGIGDTAPVMVQDYWRTLDENTPEDSNCWWR
jgi:hypothetical protein